jgi:hypothetical protein
MIHVSGLKESDLGEAYKKDGVAFREQLEKNFVVLHNSTEVLSKTPNTQKPVDQEVGTPRKRPRMKQEMSQAQSLCETEATWRG